MSGKKLREVRKAKGFSLEKLAESIGISIAQLSRFESETREPRLKEIGSIAEVLNVDVSEIYPEFVTPKETASGPHDIKNVPVVGFTQAGVWTEFESFEDDGFHGEQIPHVPGKWSKLQQYAFKVRGNSMDVERIFDGDFVVVVNYFDARSDIVDGDRVVIERVRNSATERTIKQIVVRGKEVHFCPRSTDPRHKPIIVKITQDMREADDTEVRLVGLVIGRWSPF